MKSVKHRIVRILPVLALVVVFQSVIATSPQITANTALVEATVAVAQHLA